MKYVIIPIKVWEGQYKNNRFKCVNPHPGVGEPHLPATVEHGHLEAPVESETSTTLNISSENKPANSVNYQQDPTVPLQAAEPADPVTTSGPSLQPAPQTTVNIAENFIKDTPPKTDVLAVSDTEDHHKKTGLMDIDLAEDARREEQCEELGCKERPIAKNSIQDFTPAPIEKEVQALDSKTVTKKQLEPVKAVAVNKRKSSRKKYVNYKISGKQWLRP